MKTAIYIRNGRTQVVLTPENDIEKMAIKTIEDSEHSLTLARGTFYDCQGGWTRQRAQQEDDSLMIVVDRASPPDTQEGW